MTTITTYHVRHRDDRWVVEAEDNKQPSAQEDRKADAVTRVREIARNQQPSRVVIHKQDGSVQEEFTYGDLPQREGGLAVDAIYALAALSGDALALASETIQMARELPTKAQERTEELRDLASRRDELDDRVKDLRETLEQRFDEKATEGRNLAENLLSDDRIQRVIEQAKAAQSQVKAAITSIRKVGERATKGAAEAGEEQLEAARTQIKAAATSLRKTADTAVEEAEKATE